MKTHILIIIATLCSLSVFAQNKLAILNESEASTYIRSGQRINYEIVDTIFANEFFYFQLLEKSDWVRVTASKSRQTEGFIPKSKIQELEKLDAKILTELISKILIEHKILAEYYNKAFTLKDSLDYISSLRALESHSDSKYDPILSIIAKHFCSSNNIEVLQLLFASMWANNTSANEMPSVAISACFICNPNLVIQQLSMTKIPEQKAFIIEQIQWGLLNHFQIKDNEKSENPEYNRLKSLLEKV